VTYRPPPVRPRLYGLRTRLTGRRATTAGLLVAVLGVALFASVPAFADPRVDAKEAQARQVLAEIQALDSKLSKSIEAYDAANVRLDQINTQVRLNRREMGIARRNLGVAQDRLARRLRDLYVGGDSASTLELFLGSSSVEDLINRLDTIDRVSSEDTQVLSEVKRFRREVEVRAAELKTAHARQVQIVAERAAAKREIESQISERHRLVDSIKTEIARIKAEEAQQQAYLRQQAAARLAAQQTAQSQALAATVVGATAVTPEVAVAPPSRYGGVVGIAMQYLGTPYVWGGSSPGGFDCSGFVMFVFAQVGVSLPHHAASQYNYGVPVSRDQLEPGDLVFFDGLGHVGIYIGNDEFIHSPHTGDVVKISSLSDSWYAATYVGARRII
jgi:peptidoglycan DL-endopeptidase CwlO